MKIARFIHQENEMIGILNDATSSINIIEPNTSEVVDDVIANIEILANGGSINTTDKSVPIDEVSFLPPILRPSKNIICVGKNYSEHAVEFSKSGFDHSAKDKKDIVPDAPIIFTKAACTMVGAHDDVVVPWDITQMVDYEAELGVVIGKGGRSISKDTAYEHVWGYTVINDVTARDLQAKHKQWLLGKSIDTFCPIGPTIVSADELDPENLAISCWVNGDLRQNANTKDLIFDIPSIIASVSASMSLAPGDIIATGTPAGVGIGFDPPKFLNSGDVVKVSINNIGDIENTIR